jgi:hypothetical protein
MSSPSRAEILHRAKEAFRKHGPGFVVVVEDREEPHYGVLPEVEERLEDDPDAKTLIDSVVVVVGDVSDSADHRAAGRLDRKSVV